MSRQAFVITVTGELDEQLREEFNGVTITVDHSVSRIRLVDVDASALHGVLHHIEALGLELLDVQQVDTESPGQW